MKTLKLKTALLALAAVGMLSISSCEKEGLRNLRVSNIRNAVIVFLLLLISSVATKAQLIYSVEIDTLQYPHILVLDYNTGSSSTDLDSVTHVYDSLEDKYIVNAYFSSTTGTPSFEGSGKQELIPLQKEFPFDISINMYKEIDGSSILLDSAIYADNEVVITGTSTNHVETITNMSMAYGNSHDTITINVNQFYACDNIENTDIEYDSESNTRIIRLYFESGMCYNYGQLFEGINGEKVIIEASEPSNLKIYTIYSDNRCEEEYITDSLILSVDDIRGDDYFVSVFTSDTNMGIVEGRGFYDANTNVTIKAVANENYVFERWNDGNTDNPRTIQLTQDSTFVAYFKEKLSIEDYNVDDVKITTMSKAIVIENCEGKSIGIYDVMGRCIVNEPANGENIRQYNIPKTGLYIIKIDNKGYKVIIK